MHWQRHKGGAQHHRVAERLGRRLEVAVAIGPDPALAYAATAPMPEGLDELLRTFERMNRYILRRHPIPPDDLFLPYRFYIDSPK